MEEKTSLYTPEARCLISSKESTNRTTSPTSWSTPLASEPTETTAGDIVSGRGETVVLLLVDVFVFVYAWRELLVNVNV